MWLSEVRVFVKVPLGSPSSSAKTSHSARGCASWPFLNINRSCSSDFTKCKSSALCLEAVQRNRRDWRCSELCWKRHRQPAVASCNIRDYVRGKKAPSWDKSQPQQAGRLEDQHRWKLSAVIACAVVVSWRSLTTWVIQRVLQDERAWRSREAVFALGLVD